MKKLIAVIICISLFARCKKDPKDNIPSSLKNGLVAYYPFNGNANDESGNGNNGIVNGATLTNDRFGNPNKAYSFDGISNYINCGNKNILQLNNFAISLWSNLKASANWSSGQNGGGFFLHKGCDNPLPPVNGWSYRIYYQSPYGLVTDQFGVNRSYLENNVNNLFDQWNNIIFTYDGIKLKLYYNGNIINSLSINDNTAVNNNNLLFGCRNELKNNNCVLDDFFTGQLDDIRIYNRALTQDEITYLANN